jgi:hypothetical protein
MTSAARTQEISREEWPRFLDIFSKGREGWLVSIEILDTEIGDQLEAERMKLRGITFEDKGSEPPAVLIMVDRPTGDHMTQQILNPKAIRLERSELASGTFEAMQVETEGGTTTLVRFHAGTLPEGEE